ncbi:MAG: DUF3168 domain-containing protein [Caulobacteraceae bacterium]|nr:DUF3168 domain-containing protein [Caulobacteraceae bacterium]
MAAETAIQGALFTALSGLGLRVVDRAAQAADGGSVADYPFVEVGFIIVSAMDTARENGFDYVARIHTRSRSTSMKEVKDIQGQIYGRLHRGDLTISGLHHILIRRVSSQVLDAPDGSFHGVCEYRGLADVV